MASHMRMLLATTDKSITWKCNATVQYDAAKLSPGNDYKPTVDMSLVGKSDGGWKNPVYLEIQMPWSSDVPSNNVNRGFIKLNSFSDFGFPNFQPTTPNDNNTMITLTATTKQEANLDSMLLFSNTITMAEGKGTAPLSICWNLEFTVKDRAANLTPGSNYQFSIPLNLKGKSKEGWKEVVTLEVVLPDGKKLANTVDPNDIPLNNDKNFMSKEFYVDKSEGEITLNVITEQRRNLKSALVVGDITLVPQ